MRFRNGPERVLQGHRRRGGLHFADQVKPNFAGRVCLNCARAPTIRVHPSSSECSNDASKKSFGSRPSRLSSRWQWPVIGLVARGRKDDLDKTGVHKGLRRRATTLPRCPISCRHRPINNIGKTNMAQTRSKTRLWSTPGCACQRPLLCVGRPCQSMRAAGQASMHSQSRRRVRSTLTARHAFTFGWSFWTGCCRARLAPEGIGGHPRASQAHGGLRTRERCALCPNVRSAPVVLTVGELARTSAASALAFGRGRAPAGLVESIGSRVVAVTHERRAFRVADGDGRERDAIYWAVS